MRRRYDRLQFWMENLMGDWISLPLKDIAPGDIDAIKRGKTSWARAIVGVGFRR